MCAMELTDGNDQQPARPTRHHRAPVIWPWLIVVAAWTLAGFSVLTNQSSLINHLCWLLRASVRNNRHGVHDGSRFLAEACEMRVQ